jgi:hypothetical protein
MRIGGIAGSGGVVSGGRFCRIGPGPAGFSAMGFEAADGLE